MKKHKVMFVCTGNICRSPLAHAVLEHKAAEGGLANLLELESSGLHSYHVGEQADQRMRKTAEQHGVNLSHKARRLRSEDLAEYDLLLAMDRSHLREMQSMAAGAPELVQKIRLFGSYIDSARAPDIPDPYYGGQEGFERVFEMVDAGCSALLDTLSESQG